MKIDRIVIATGNAGKVREIGEIFQGSGVRLTSLRDHWPDVPDIPETGETFLENARLKAKWVFSRLGLWTLADDSGLEVDALGGKPGVISAIYAGENATDEENLRKLLCRLEPFAGNLRKARFRCVMALMGNGREIVSEGICEGRITYTPAGQGGFGYDPVFVPDGYEETFAQLDAVRKNSVSHRGRALQGLRKAVNEHLA